MCSDLSVIWKVLLTVSYRVIFSPARSQSSRLTGFVGCMLLAADVLWSTKSYGFQPIYWTSVAQTEDIDDSSAVTSLLPCEQWYTVLGYRGLWVRVASRLVRQQSNPPANDTPLYSSMKNGGIIHQSINYQRQQQGLLGLPCTIAVHSLHILQSKHPAD